jgi:hypothetical protein
MKVNCDRKKFTTLPKLRWLNRGTGLMRIQILHEDRTMKDLTTFDANHIKEIIVELYSSLMILPSR